MKKQLNLLEGNVSKSLTKLALPIMGTSLIQMAYNMVDMAWIGRLGSDALASVGAAGMFMWLANGLSLIAKIGGQVHTGQQLGANRKDLAKNYITHAFQLNIILAVLYGIFSILFSDALIGLFNLNSPTVVNDAQSYLRITCGIVIFSYINQTFTGIYTAIASSRTILTCTFVGLFINLILDPLLIFGIGPLPGFGVIGAAIATVFAQAIVTVLFIINAKSNDLFRGCNILSFKMKKDYLLPIIKVGLPTSLQSMLFTAISMTISRLIASYGDAAIAIQRVGTQVESLSWMAADGFSAAVNSFIAQNYGAKNYKRVKQGYKSAMILVSLWGIFTTLVLLLFPEQIYGFFIHDNNIISLGVDYLIILSFSQLFMCIEIATNGAFAGIGRTVPPSIISLTLTAARIPLAIYLTTTILGLNGIWWSITISSILKGITLFIYYIFTLKKDFPNSSE